MQGKPTGRSAAVRALVVKSYGLNREEPSLTSRHISIGVIGGGIGGLAAALSLLRAGLDGTADSGAGTVGMIDFPGTSETRDRA